MASPDGSTPPPALGYQPAFDGLRAVAVVAVMGYHFGVPHAVGGFLGVDVFFVLSGFLITTLLAEEHRATGTIRLADFYLRRILRLFPALLLLIGALQLYSLWFYFPEQVVELRRESLLALFYVSNWAAVLGVFPAVGFLTHTWSLSIEEQFYIVWPVVLRGLLARLRPPTAMVLAAALAAASALLRFGLWRGPESFSRVYHGSDTRAEALLVGAFVALGLHWFRLPATAVAQRCASVGAAAAAALVLGMMSSATLHDGVTMTWGLSAVALSVALLIVGIRWDAYGGLARSLAFPPLVAIGRVSYGLYLWHVPVLLVCTPETLGLGDRAVMATRFAATFAAAALSWVLVERPFLAWKTRLSAARRNS